MRSCMERSVVERVEDSDGGEKKQKKKNRRRSNRRSKQNISSPSGREAEESHLNQRLALERKPDEAENTEDRYFAGLHFNDNASDSEEEREAFSLAAVKHAGIPRQDERKLVSTNVMDACSKFYMWLLINKKETLLSEATVLALGPKFMSIHVPQLTIERRIYYDGVEGLSVEWLEATSTVILTVSGHKSSCGASPVRNIRPLEESVMLVSPLELDQGPKFGPSAAYASTSSAEKLGLEMQPLAFPVTVSLLSTIPVLLHAVGGEGVPVDICARLYVSSYLK